MIRFIDDQLNKITMYRLTLYYLISLLVAAEFLSAAGILHFDPIALLLSVAMLLAVCAVTNLVFAQIFNVPANVESIYISALILALIITPGKSLHDLWFPAWVAILAMASKYIVAYKGKHLFNPAAFAVAITYFTINQSASWWVGSGAMILFVLLGGLLIVRKIERFDMVLSFLITALVTVWGTDLFMGTNAFVSTQNVLLSSPLLFFAFIILTEPLTTPPTHKLRMYYGVLAGLLYAPQLHLGSFFLTPEVIILIGNTYSYIVSPKANFILRLKDKTLIAPDMYEFAFNAPRKFTFAPGQYMEWTLGHDEVDSRGNRRYFTLASSPTEHTLKLAVKFYQESSTYKKAMLAMSPRTEIVASHLAGDFVLPLDPRQKCVFLAGGIGITPFRSMVKYLLDTRQRRPITLFYAARNVDDIIYKDVFDRAEKDLGLKTIYSLTDNKNIPPSWNGKVGRISPEMIRTHIPDYGNYIFYISGPRGMVNSFKDTLKKLGIDNSHIKTDYFAGLA